MSERVKLRRSFRMVAEGMRLLALFRRPGLGDGVKEDEVDDQEFRPLKKRLRSTPLGRRSGSAMPPAPSGGNE